MMNRILIGALVWLAVVLPGFGASTVIPVTPKDIDWIDQFKFAVTNGTVNNGLSFHVVITAKDGSVPTDCEGYLCVATLTEHSGDIGPMTSKTRVTLKAREQAWVADFIPSKQLLSNPDGCFVFAVPDHRGPSADFYVLKLHDFVKQ